MATDITDENGNLIAGSAEEIEDDGGLMEGVEGVSNGNKSILKDVERQKREALKV